MAGNFQKTTSNFFITFFIGLIVVSFMFTGYETMKGAPDTIAKVGSIPIKVREYQSEYNRQIGFYQQIFGGKTLTRQQIEQFKVQDNAINNLVKGKLLLKLANDAAIHPAPNRIKDMVKKYPYWQTAGKFDLNKYKAVLAANRLTPKDFEKDTARGAKGELAQSLFTNFPLSNGYLNDIVKFKKQRVSIDAIQYTKESLRKHLNVSKKEIADYFSKPDNKARIESTFEERKKGYEIPEKVKASHILIKAAPGKEALAKKEIEKIQKQVNIKNFKSLANKYTQDPSGKGKGGSLNTFSRGKMVPEFDRVAFNQKAGTISSPVKTSFGYHLIFVEKKIKAIPAKFKSHKDKLIKEQVRGEKNKELDQLAAKVSKQLKEALDQSQDSKIKKLVKKYGLSYEKKVEVNKFEGSKGSIPLDRKITKDLFQKDAISKKTQVFDDVSRTTLFKVYPFKSKGKKEDVSAEQEKKGLLTALSQKLRQNVIQFIQENTKVKVYTHLLR